MSLYEPKRAFDVRSLLAECATWSVAEQAFYWEDIHGFAINRIDPVTGAHHSWTLPAKPGCFALKAGGGLIVAAQDGFYDLDTRTGVIQLIRAAPFDPATHRFNDGALDRQGRFWAGSIFADFPTLGIEAARGKGVYYRFDGREMVAGIPDITMPNGTAFSPDGRTMYRAESFDHTIWAYDYDVDSGLPSNPRVFARVPPEFGVPDGAAVDAAGHYWSALPTGGGWVLRFDPRGELVGRYRMPTQRPTMCTFGGADLSTLYVTSMGYPDRDPATDPDAGCIFMMETDVQGLASPLFPAQGR